MRAIERALAELVAVLGRGFIGVFVLLAYVAGALLPLARPLIAPLAPG